MSTLRNFLSGVGGLFRRKASNKPSTDLTKVPSGFMPAARPGIRQKIWLRNVLKARLRLAFTLSKLEKKGVRRNVFQGYWIALARRGA